MRIPVSTRFTLRTGGKSFRDAVHCLPGGRGGNARLAEATPVHLCLTAWGKKGAGPVRLQRREMGPVVRNHRKMFFNSCQEVMCPLLEKRLVDSHPVVGYSRNLPTGRKAVWSSIQRPILTGTVSTIHPLRW